MGRQRGLLALCPRYRRLSKDYELLPEVSESMVYAAMLRLMQQTIDCLIFSL